MEKNTYLAIKGGTLIDIDAGGYAKDSVILIKGERIDRVGHIDEVSIPANSQIIDAKGKFVIPGLIDMHVHYDDWQPELFLNHGVTTVVDLAQHDWVWAQRVGIAKNKIFGPRMYNSSEIFSGQLHWNVRFQEIGGPDGGREKARRYIEKGVEVIKTYTLITPDELRAMSEEAHIAGLPVMAHVASIDAREAAELGADGLAHATGIALATISDKEKKEELRAFEKMGIAVDYPHYLLYHAYMDPKKADELIKILVWENMALEPDLVNTASRWASKNRLEYKEMDRKVAKAVKYLPQSRRDRALAYDAPLKRLSPEQRKLIPKAYKNLQGFLRKFVEAGGTLLAGSDCASFCLPGISLQRELELFVEAGLTPRQAMLTATKNNSEWLHKDKEVGSIEKGKFADVIILNGDPLQDIRKIREVDTVIKNGDVIDIRFHDDYKNPIPMHTPPWVYIANPPPKIKYISPYSASEGSNGINVIIEGEDFLESTKARFAGQDIAVRPVFSTQIEGTDYLPYFTQLEATIPAKHLKKAGLYPIQLSNPTPEGGESNEGYFIVRH